MAFVTNATPSSADTFGPFPSESTHRRETYTPRKDFGRSLTWVERVLRPHYAQQPVFEPAEVAALLKYASERGIDTADHLLRRLYRALNEYNENPRAEITVVVDGVQQPMPYAEVILNEYTRLAKLTGGVNGCNLLHGRHLVRETHPFMLLTLVLFVVSIGALAYSAWIADHAAADDSFLPAGVAHAVQYFAPFAWGALGSCVYILKRISDEAAANRFDPDRFQGWQIRAVLGAVLGATITYMIDPRAFGSVTLGATAVAFSAGLATKILYGGIERTIELLAEKLNLGGAAREKSKSSAFREYVAQEISSTDPAMEPEKYRILAQLCELRTLDRANGDAASEISKMP